MNERKKKCEHGEVLATIRIRQDGHTTIHLDLEKRTPINLGEILDDTKLTKTIRNSTIRK